MIVAGVAPTVVEFPAPAPLLNMNHRTHWRVQRANALAWRTAAWLHAREQLGYGTELVPSFVTVELPVLGARRRDPHNYFPTVKPVVDGLVDAGLWPDDTPEWVTTTEPTLRAYGTRAEGTGMETVRVHPVCTRCAGVGHIVVQQRHVHRNYSTLLVFRKRPTS